MIRFFKGNEDIFAWFLVLCRRGICVSPLILHVGVFHEGFALYLTGGKYFCSETWWIRQASSVAEGFALWDDISEEVGRLGDCVGHTVGKWTMV
jgi:hypothetical protein